ncbi:MAG: 3-oxoacyl-[acyl-carrier-protein] reductase [Bacteroidota bacterium]
MQPLTGKKALITGATKGIGRAIAKKLATAGADIACTYLHSTQEAHTLLEELQAIGTRVYAYQNDAANHNAVQTLIEKVMSDLGGLDILVNNAGITQDHLLLRMDEQAWDKVLQVNLKSAFNTVKATTKIFIKQRSGVIINISSVVGIRGNAGQANYAASKAGLIGFTKSVALELGAKNIRANVIAPGLIHTQMTADLAERVAQDWVSKIPLRRIGTPEDVANCALFLASDAASYITGQVIQVDGGIHT